MATIENFATVSYTSGGVASTKTSNLAQIELDSSLNFSKTTLGSVYTANTPITYIISITNDGATAVNGLVVTDDLGTFTQNAAELTPLTFVEPALLLINGQDTSSELTVDASNPAFLSFTLPTLAPSATANIVYKALPNNVAPLEAGSTITNTATVSGDVDCADGTDSSTVSVAEAADIEVVKNMSPNPVVCGDEVTYTIRIYNYGNTAAEDVRLTDTFVPAPENISVFRNGVLLVATDYNYVDGTLTVPATGTEGDTVPAATFTRDTTTGEVTVTPGVVEYVVTGTI
jgi:uncharacterized repeat protein (TIGR01451 family)